MLLMNKTLLKLARGLWLWILAIAGVGFLTLVGTTALAEIIAGFLGTLFQPPGRAGCSCIYLSCPALKRTVRIQDRCKGKRRHAENDLFQSSGIRRRRHRKDRSCLCYHSLCRCRGTDADLFQYLPSKSDLQCDRAHLSVLSFKEHFHACGCFIISSITFSASY